MKLVLSVLLVLLTASSLAASEQQKSLAASEQPNILLMIADDCTFRDLGCYGGQAHTPHIDRLAQQGMRFTHCFQAAPMCSPTRHNIYTGLYPVTSGAYPNHTHVEPATKSVVQYLRKAGYRVAQSGKTHVGPRSVFAWEKIPGSSNPEFDKVDAFLADCVQASEPFCLLLCSNEPHSPWNKGDASRYPPEEIKLPPYLFDTPATREARSRYLAEVTYYDSQVGQALKLLDKHAVTDNTLVVVLSEQGSSFPFAKWTCYDAGIQSAMIARWPGRIEPGSENRALVEYIDLLPTFVEVAGGNPAAALQGESLLPQLAGKQSHKEYVFAEMTTRGINNGSPHYGIRSIRSRQFKYIWNFTPEVVFRNACTASPEFQSWVKLADQGNENARAAVQRYTVRPGVELYDVLADTYEMNNLADDPKYEEIKTKLRAELDAWMKRCGDRGQPTELDAYEHMSRGRKKKQ